MRCERCAALAEALKRERKIHAAERRVTGALVKLPKDRRGPVLRAAMALLGLNAKARA